MKSGILAVAAAITVAGASSAAMSADLIIDAPVEPVVISEPGDWYVSLFGGVVSMPTIDALYNDGPDTYDISTDLGYTLGITVGTKVFDMLRVEAELSGTVNSISELDSSYWGLYTDYDGSVSALYLLGNAWLDFDTGAGITPYIGGGLGWASVNVSLDDWSWELEGSGLAYQVGGGVKFDVADNLAVDLGYRYKAVPNVTVDDVDGDPDWLNFDLSSHVFQAGLTLKF
ncbi:MAG: outer membrane protein [Devosia sp.]